MCAIVIFIIFKLEIYYKDLRIRIIFIIQTDKNVLLYYVLNSNQIGLR